MKKAFTLIELLVVIAIIAILAAILFPVFAQAKLAAKKTNALSNIKQINLGSVMYSGDADDMMMPKLRIGYGPGFGGDPEVAMPWDKLVYPYQKSYALVMVGEDTGTKYNTPYGKVRRSFAVADNAFRGVQVNNDWGGYGNHPAGWKAANSATAFPQPSDTVTFGQKFLQILSTDANAWKTQDWATGMSINSTRRDNMPASDNRAQYGEVANRYSEGSVWGFADGHAAFKKANGRAQDDGVLHGTIFPGYREGAYPNGNDPHWDKGISCFRYDWYADASNDSCPVPGE